MSRNPIEAYVASLPEGSTDALLFGNEDGANYRIPPDTFATQDELDALVISGGGISVASDAEAKAGTNDTKAMTPAKVKLVNAWVDPRSFGAVGDGVADDTTALQDAFDAVAGGGTVRFPGPSFSFLITDTLDVTRTDWTDLVLIDFNGSSILWGGGAATMIEFDGGGSNSAQRGPMLRDANINGADTATCGFRWTDCGMSRFIGTTRVEDIAGPGFHFRNNAAFSENVLVEDARVSGSTMIAKYSGASDTGGAGSASFARQRWISMHGASLTTCWVQIDSGASVYDSRIEHVKGNMGQLAVPVFDITDGTGANFVVEHVAIEQGDTGAYLFDFNSTTGHGPIVLNGFPRDDIELVTGGDITNFNKFAPTVSGITVPENADVEMDGTSAVVFGTREIIRHEEITLTASVATALTCCANLGAFLLCIASTSGNPAGVWAVSKRASGTSVTSVASLSSVNGASGETLTVAWNFTNGQPQLTASADMTVYVTAIKA